MFKYQEETPVEETPIQEESKDEKPVEEPVEKKEDESKFYETPDGRQVTAEELQKEWKENFLPEFTRKSQELADIKRNKEQLNSPPKDEPAWKKDDYVPQNYAEVIEIAKKEAIEEVKGGLRGVISGRTVQQPC